MIAESFNQGLLDTRQVAVLLNQLQQSIWPGDFVPESGGSMLVVEVRAEIRDCRHASPCKRRSGAPGNRFGPKEAPQAPADSSRRAATALRSGCSSIHACIWA